MYSPLRYAGHILWKRRPIQLTFFVTKKCNARCPFCFYLQKQGTPVGSQPELSLQEIERFASSLGNLLWLAFSGGEVYLRKDIVDISKVFYKHNRPVLILYSTNGLQPELIEARTEEILKNCPDSTVVVKLSLDGLGAEHDALRGVAGSFDKVMETHQRLGELLKRYQNFELGFNTVFCAANHDRIAELSSFVKSLPHGRAHTYSMIRGQLTDERLKNIDLDKYQEAIDSLEAGLKRSATARYHFLGARLKSAQDILQRRCIYRTISEKRRLLPCYAGRLNLVVTETGDVYPCELLDKRVGSVRVDGYDINKILASADAKEVLHHIRMSRCYCSHECYTMTNILFNPRMYPALIKQYLQL